ncbi:hypothetical protein [Clostridium saccharoperbutylacetonicum]|uniref:hypothetical protein n=1 Tax=Clostridium saccharoperbutylacetonicum TaxID=36745 RepID=UPI000983BF57|nr:hypothetical protein [Clostridium saccharoperbutylacetonicum]AQR94243.1 hypothetical protein CLSAP_15500 [Clostridium saccharoperbutylacetonicum]NSB29943.1 hypothetical protein [Clostridium saccharoperbutylacetonicum]
MEAFHKLKIECPYSILNIEDIKICCRPSEHGYLYIKCLIDDSLNFKYATEASTEDKIVLYEELENNEKSIIFNGIVQNIKTTNKTGLYYLELEAASSSINLDITEKTRSFQDYHMSYDNLVKEILRDYKIYGFTQCMSEPRSIGKPLFQYKETDWDFLKRVASHLGLELICDIIKAENAFFLGRPTGRSYEVRDDINYKACKDLDAYHKALSNGFGVDLHDTDFFYYEVEVRDKLEIGDIIYFKQKNLYVNQFEAELQKGELIYKYRFCRKDGIWIDKLYNHKIKGVSLEGKVLERNREMLKLHLNIDEGQNPATAAWFYYTPPTGNILYSMPLVGENAMLYFQDEIKAAPIATNCVRKNGDACDDFSDTNNRYLATETGDYLDMLPGAINFHRSGLNVNLNDENGITFSSSGNLSVSGGSVSISGGSVSINASSKIRVQKGKSGYISLENEFYSEAGSTSECGSDRQSYGAFTDDEPTAGVKEALAKLREKGIIEKKINGNLTFAMAGAQPYLGMPATLDDFLADRAAVVKVNPADLLPKSELVHDDGKGIPISGEGLKNKEDVPEFNSNICHAEGSYVKEEVNGEYVLGQERHILVSTGYKSYFDPIDKTPGTLGPSKQQMAVLGRTIIYLIPFVGQVIYIGETVFGYDAFTGKKLSTEQRVMNVLLLGFGIFLGSAARSASRELDAEASAEISMMNSADKEIADFTKGTESIAGDGKTILDKDIYKDLEANGGYKGLEVNDGYKELEVNGGYKGPEVNDGYKELEVNNGYKEPVYEEPEVNSGYKEPEGNNGYKNPEYDYKSNEDWNGNYNTNSGRNPNKYCLSGEEHYESLKDLFGAENVEWISKDAKGITFERMIDSTLQKYRFKLLDKYTLEELGAKVNIVYDIENAAITEMAVSGNHSYNPTILGKGEIFDQNLFKNKFNKNYEKYYNHLLSDEYVDSLPESYFDNKGLSRVEVKSELSKLRDAIDNTKQVAKEKYGDKAINEYGNYSFQKDWNVENCAEIWSSRKAIMNGAKFDNIGLRCISMKDGSFATPCKNCKQTFGGHTIIKDKDLE